MPSALINETEYTEATERELALSLECTRLLNLWVESSRRHRLAACAARRWRDRYQDSVRPPEKINGMRRAMLANIEAAEKTHGMPLAQIVSAYQRDGYSYDDVAFFLGVSKRVLMRWLRIRGVAPKAPHERVKARRAHTPKLTKDK